MDNNRGPNDGGIKIGDGGSRGIRMAGPGSVRRKCRCQPARATISRRPGSQHSFPQASN